VGEVLSWGWVVHRTLGPEVGDWVTAVGVFRGVALRCVIEVRFGIGSAHTLQGSVGSLYRGISVLYDGLGAQSTVRTESRFSLGVKHFFSVRGGVQTLGLRRAQNNFTIFSVQQMFYLLPF
jgi:hypothetical protein